MSSLKLIGPAHVVEHNGDLIIYYIEMDAISRWLKPVAPGGRAVVVLAIDDRVGV